VDKVPKASSPKLLVRARSSGQGWQRAAQAKKERPKTRKDVSLMKEKRRHTCPSCAWMAESSSSSKRKESEE